MRQSEELHSGNFQGEPVDPDVIGVDYVKRDGFGKIVVLVQEVIGLRA